MPYFPSFFQYFFHGSYFTARLINTIGTFSGTFFFQQIFSTKQKREEELRLSAEANSLGLDPAKSELHSLFLLTYVCPIERTYKLMESFISPEYFWGTFFKTYF